MGYGTYATIADLKGILGITATTDDTIMRKICESSSRAIDRYTGRYFHTTKETKYFDGATRLWIPDLLSIDTSGLKTDEDGDLDYDNTLATTDYILYPLNGYPKTRIEIDPNGDYSSFASGIKKGVSIAGTWGYGDGITATPYIEDTTIAEDLTAGEAAVDVTSVTNLSPGNVLLIGSEQYYIYSIATLTLTTEPGVNGTTEATHSSGAPVNIYQYPADIRQACIDLAVDLYQNRAKRGIESERIGDYSYTMSQKVLNDFLDTTIKSYRVMKY